MLPRVRTGALARLAAALTALALSGTPRVLAMHAPAERHQCSCRAHAGGRHECECAMCKKAALAAQASDASAPPCHRAAARKALSSGSEGAARRRGAPCVEGTCGQGGGQAPTVAGEEPFCLPDAVTRTRPLGLEAPPRCFEYPQDRAIAPPTPRPRAA
jgi:hypothetical protein